MIDISVKANIIVISLSLMNRANRNFDPEKFFAALSDRNRHRLINLMGEDDIGRAAEGF